MSQLNYENLINPERKRLLLQVLGFEPLTIAQIKSGEVLLSDALSKRIDEVLSNPLDTTQCAIVCQNIKRDGVSYETLDAVPYLEHINELKAKGGKFADDIPGYGSWHSSDTSNVGGPPPDFGPQTASDKIMSYNPSVSIYSKPVLRYFVRTLDLSIYLLVINLMFRLFAGVDPMSNTRITLGWLLLVYASMFAIEPVFIHLWGTTPAKFLLGIRITNPDDSKLSWQAAYRRSFRLLRFGFGFVIPFYNIITMIRSCIDCRNGRILVWDLGIKISRPERLKGSRIAIFVAVLLAVSFADSFFSVACEMPRNRGEITEEEFYENCEHIVKYSSIVFEDIPSYTVTTDAAGHVNSVSFNVTASDRGYIYGYYNEMYVAFMAFAGAQDSANAVTLFYSEPIAYLRNCLTDFSTSYAGLAITNKVEHPGYSRNILSDYLYQNSDSSEHVYTQSFTISKSAK